MFWRCRDRAFDLAERPLVMGILNVTPDSFSEGGRHLEPAAAVARAREMIAAGADLIDIGAESTRPGAAAVAPEEQWQRMEPVLDALAPGAVAFSIDTSSAEVARRSLAHGARVINDVTSLGDPDMASVVAEADAGLVLMHMRETPATMQNDPHYDDPVAEIRDWLAGRIRAARAAGIAPDRIAIDPGIGFGKTLEHNLQLLAGLDAFAILGHPVLIGLSRKRFIGTLLDRGVDERLEGGLAATAIAVFQGAGIVRTHDVPATALAVRMSAALRAARRPQASALET